MKKIYRSKKDRIIGGVCGGISENFNIDPSIVRIVALILLLLNGFTFLVYILAWIIIPKDNSYLSPVGSVSDNKSELDDK